MTEDNMLSENSLALIERSIEDPIEDILDEPENVENIQDISENYLEKYLEIQEPAPTLTVYILKLENDKYYVGKTSRITDRVLEHFTGKACAWTQRYKPIEVLKIYEGCSNYEEDRITEEMMGTYGIDNVRGGSYVQMELDFASKEVLERKIRMAKNLCLKCGSPDHFIRDCSVYNRVHNDYRISSYYRINTPIVPSTMRSLTDGRPYTTFSTTKPISVRLENPYNFSIKQERDTLKIPENIKSHAEHSQQPCSRCGRMNHKREQCYARTDANGQNLTLECVRCGRNNHSITSCYARTHMDGTLLAQKTFYPRFKSSFTRYAIPGSPTYIYPGRVNHNYYTDPYKKCCVM